MRLSLFVLSAWLLAAGGADAQPRLEIMGLTPPAVASRTAPAIVKVFTVYDSADHYSPWQTLGIDKAIGSGAIIEGNRILTNAHVVADQRSVSVKRSDRPRRYEATVAYVSHQADLAILEVDAPGFFEDVDPLRLGRMAMIGDQVALYGYPEGGDSISLTSGIVSRIEMQTYVHSDETLLAVQIDAALNSGNSGGPVLVGTQLVGVAMQMLEDAENIGYVVPAPVIEQFLKDTEDGRVDGVPRLGIQWQAVIGNAHKERLGLPRGASGLLVNAVSEGSTADGALLAGDVVTHIDGNAIGEDVTISTPEGRRVALQSGFQFKQVGDALSVTVLRSGESHDVEMKLLNTRDLIPGPIYDTKPSYFVFGGLVMQPLGYDYLDVWEEWPSQMAHYYENENLRTSERHQMIILSQILSARVNRGYQDFELDVIDRIDGKVPRDMRHVVEIVQSASDPTIRVQLLSGYEIVLDREQAASSNASILARYGIPADRSEDLENVAASE